MSPAIPNEKELLIDYLVIAEFATGLLHGLSERRYITIEIGGTELGDSLVKLLQQ